MKDRVPAYPGRVILTPVSGQSNTYDMERADAPTEEGPPLNTNTLLKGATAELLNLTAEDPTPDDALNALYKLAAEAEISADRLPIIPINKGGTEATTAAEARANLGLAGALTSPVQNDFYTLTPPDGSFVTSLRAPFGGLLPYNSGGNGSLGNNDNPWSLGFINSLTSQTITCTNIVGTNVYGSSLGWTTLWSGTFTSGTITISNARKYAAIIISGRPGTNEANVLACHVPTAWWNNQLASNLYYLSYTLATEGDDDVTLEMRQNDYGGSITAVWGIVKIRA